MVKKHLSFLLVLFACFLVFSTENRAQDEGGGYAGSEACKDCHQEQYDSYLESPHGIQANPWTPAAKQGCESCHGPGSAHVSEGGGKGVGGIIPLSSKSATSAEVKSAPCLGCHTKGKVALWDGSAHEGRGISCSNCHSVHSGEPKNLARPDQTEVCSQCHKDIKAQIQKSSHHPIREGKMTCSSCHNPHGTVAEKLLSANSLNEKCYECHTEKRGPFLWEHPPATENCAACHTPHGTSHDKLLVAKRPYLCQRCHSNSRHPGTLYGRSDIQDAEGVPVSQLSNRLYDRNCQNCHNNMHGSNHPSGKSLGR